MQFFTTLLVSSTTLFIKSVAAQSCTGQGAGSCNLQFVGYNSNDQITWNVANVYDNRCSLIGSQGLPKQGMALTSQLPLTVVVQRLSSDGDYNNMAFCYGSFCYDGNFACKFDETDHSQTCIRAFPCAETK